MSDRRRRRARPPREDRDREAFRREEAFRHEADAAFAAAAGDSRTTDSNAADPEDAAAEARARAEALAEFERTRDALLRARRDGREPGGRDSDGRDRGGRKTGVGRGQTGQTGQTPQGGRGRADRIPVRPGAPNPRPIAAPAGAAAVPSAGAAAGRGYSLLTPRRAVRRDGPVAWAGRRYRRFRRGLRENLTALGHRYNAVGGGANEGRPLLLWLVDLPRLVGMYAGHAEYRFTRATTLLFRDLRSRPPGIRWDKDSVFSPLVGSARPTWDDLNPVWRWPAVALFWAKFREDWRAALADTVGELAGIWANFKAELAAEFGAIGSRFTAALAWVQANASRFDRLFRGSDQGAWAFACGTGMAGLILTALLCWRSPEAVAATAVNREGTAALTAAGLPGKPIPDLTGYGDDPADPEDPADFGDDPEEFGGAPVAAGSSDDMFFPEPDPVPVAAASSDSSAAAALPDPFGDAFAEDAFGDGPPALGPNLSVTFERRELPGEIPGYAPPDDDRPATFTAKPAERRPLPDDDGGWGDAAFRLDRRAADPPPAMSGTGPARGVSLEPLSAANSDDGVSPAAAGLGLSVDRFETYADPAAGDGRLAYELRVTNAGREPAAAAVEEVVGAGVTVVGTDPEAAFTEDPAGGGTLRWDLSDLPPGETRRLTVAVVPDAGAGELVTAARVVGAVRVAAATVVEEELIEDPAEPPPFAEEPFEPEPFDSEPFGPADAFDPADEPEPPRDDFGGGFDDFGGDFNDDFGDVSFENEPDGPAFEDEPAGEEPGFDEPGFGGEPDDVPAPPAPLPDAAVRPAQVLTPRPDPAPPAPAGAESGSPRLRVTLAGPARAAAGADVRLLVTVANNGTAPAEAVTVTCPIPPGLRHPRGSLVRCVLGDLAPRRDPHGHADRPRDGRRRVRRAHRRSHRPRRPDRRTRRRRPGGRFRPGRSRRRAAACFDAGVPIARGIAPAEPRAPASGPFSIADRRAARSLALGARAACGLAGGVTDLQRTPGSTIAAPPAAACPARRCGRGRGVPRTGRSAPRRRGRGPARPAPSRPRCRERRRPARRPWRSGRPTATGRGAGTGTGTPGSATRPFPAWRRTWN